MSRMPQDPHFHDANPRDNPRLSESYPILQFYNASEGPWFPGVIRPAEPLNSQSRPPAYTSEARCFHGYGSTGLPSDCGTAPEDSGYGGTRSIYSCVESATSITENDRGTETGYLEARTAEQLLVGLNTAVPIYQQPQMPHHQDSPVEIRCDQCGALCKTKSELKKHNHRHIKPYKCSYETCGRATQGFSTPNDLTRHKRTVHREQSEKDPFYICRHGNCSRKKEKLWPRADNFRSHLDRAHNIIIKADCDLREYRFKSDAANSHGPRDERHSAANIDPNIDPGRQPTQLQDAPLAYKCHQDPRPQTEGETWPRADDLETHSSHGHNLEPDDDLKDYHSQSAAEEVHALRGVGSSVADVDLGSLPVQLQDSPDLRGDQVSGTASGLVQNESSKQSSLSPALASLTSGGNHQLVRSNILDVLKMPSAPGAETLASHAILDLACADEVSLGESEAILPHDEGVLDSFDHDGDNALADEEEILDCPEPSMFQIDSPSASAEPKARAPQDDMPETLNTTEEPGNTLEASAEAPAAASTLDTFKPSEILRFPKDAMFDMATGDGRADILSFLRNIPKDLLEKALQAEDQAEGGGDHSIDQGEHQKTETCRECGKVFSRKCELRKHMKRHDKPYGCTYKTCGKTFGSKNDWKRHESSQHFQLESWSCNISGCDKVLPRRELFKLHLIRQHKLQDSERIDDLQETRRLGRHCDRRFWCGFCDVFVEIEGTVINSWTKRCDHIDSHLFGKEGLKKRTMSEWHYLEDKLTEGEPEATVAEGTCKASKKRKATENVNTRPSKRTNTSWNCCRCGHLESYHTSSSCQDGACQHQRCLHCRLETVSIPDEDNEMEIANQGPG